MGKSSAIRYDPIYIRRLADYAKTAEHFAATNAEIAQALGCSERTVIAWKGQHPEFKQLIEQLQHNPDVHVENAIYRAALGYEYEETTIETGTNGEKLIRYKKHQPPNISAARLWLTNRRPNEWRDKQTTEHTGEILVNDAADAILAAILAEAESEAEGESSEDAR